MMSAIPKQILVTKNNPMPRHQVIAEHRYGAALQALHRINLHLNVYACFRPHLLRALGQTGSTPSFLPNPIPPNESIKFHVILGAVAGWALTAAPFPPA